MRRPFLPLAAVLFSVFGLATVSAQDGIYSTPATPEAVGGPMTFALLERATNVTNLDLGETGPSTGDMIVWGPNRLFDESNSTDTGATTQGFCVVLNATGICELTETILFQDISTIELQGVQAAGSGSSMRTVVGGSGAYLGATGTVSIEPSDDLTLWTKTFEIWL